MKLNLTSETTNFIKYVVILILLTLTWVRLGNIEEKIELLVIPTTGTTTIDTESNYNSFARCLHEKGFVMYGSQYCGYCARQKELFGDSFKLIDYVECTEHQDICAEKNITGVPAWQTPDGWLAGLQSLEKLAEFSNCEL